MSLLLAIAVLFALWLWYMLRRPAQWESFSNKIDDFSVRKGIVTPAFAKKCKRFNRGFGRKLLIGLVATMLVGSAGSFLFFVVWISAAILLHK